MCTEAALDGSQKDAIHRHIDAEFAFLAMEWFVLVHSHIFVTFRDPGKHFMASLWQWKRVVLNGRSDYAANKVVYLLLVRIGIQRNNSKDAKTFLL